MSTSPPPSRRFRTEVDYLDNNNEITKQKDRAPGSCLPLPAIFVVVPHQGNHCDEYQLRDRFGSRWFISTFDGGYSQPALPLHWPSYVFACTGGRQNVLPGKNGKIGRYPAGGCLFREYLGTEVAKIGYRESCQVVVSLGGADSGDRTRQKGRDLREENREDHGR